MNLKEFVEALIRAADRDAADNEPKRDADSEAELIRDAYVTFSHRHDFKPRMIVRERPVVRSYQERQRVSSSRVTGPLGSGCRWIRSSVRTRMATSSPFG